MFRCNYCGAVFDLPTVSMYREDMNGEGAWQTFYTEHCPACDEEDFDELPLEGEEDEDET